MSSLFIKLICFLRSLLNTSSKPINETKRTMLTRESVARKNLTPDEVFVSETADRFNIDNETDDQEILGNLNNSADSFQEARDILGIPLTLNSFYRCKPLNKRVGGSRTSFHMRGLGFDVKSEQLNPSQIVRKIRDSNMSVDKCFVEYGCAHFQFQKDSSKNRNYYGIARRIKGGKGGWKVTKLD